MKFLNIDNYLWKFEPEIPNSFGEIIFEKSKNLQRMYEFIFWQFLIAVIFFVTDCKELELAQTV